MLLENLVTGTQANRTSITLLTKAIAELTTQVTSLIAQIPTVKSDNACALKTGYRLAHTGSTADRNPTRDLNIYLKSIQKFDPNRYCSSRGFKVEETQTSTIYIRPLDEHNNWRRKLIVREENNQTRILSTTDQQI